VITLDKDSLKARFFLRCLRAFAPFACGWDSDNKQKKPEWYIENGTTLCHFFWVCFWLPLIALGILSFFGMIITSIHVIAYREHGTIGLLIPIGSVIGAFSALTIIILVITGISSCTGLLAYLKALKERICPLITFTGEQDHESSP
jgi:hypothetical protein